MKYMPIKEFREKGLLHELNRTFLHPLGLALEVQLKEDGTEVLSGIWDCTDDPEGVCFAEINRETITKVKALQREKFYSRVEALGYWIQGEKLEG